MEKKICCDICFRTGSRRLQFLCPSDARNQLYEPRLKHAQTLVEKAGLDAKISALLSEKSCETGLLEVDDKTSQHLLSEDRTQQILVKAEELHISIQKARDEIGEKKAAVASRKKDLEKAGNGLEARRRRQVEELDKSTKMANYRWNHSHAMTVQSRGFLCGEAATIYGLCRVKTADGSPAGYGIGGVKIIDLKNMNSAKSEHISAALGHIAHLFSLATTYLSVRPPAEITLPHSNYPLPTILPVSASYTGYEIPFPGTSAANSKAASPSESRETSARERMPRPRPLFVKLLLPHLSRDDPSAYNLFIEGACLLAYDIAWVCKTQGINISPDPTSGLKSPASANSSNAPSIPRPATFEDISNIGRNLYSLMIGSQPRGVPTQAGTPTVSSEDSGRAAASLGQYSHGSMHTSLSSKEGTDLMKTFKLLNPIKLADQLKTHLMAEVIHAEWEMIDKHKSEALKGIKGPSVVENDAVDTPSNGPSQQSKPTNFMPTSAGTETVLLGGSFASLDDVSVVGSPDSQRKPGKNGWTRVKQRPPQ